MKKKIQVALLAAAALSLLVSVAYGEEEVARNPFRLTEVIRQQGIGTAGGSSHLPDRMPLLSLKGYIEGENGMTAAILEVQGMGAYPVRSGDTLSLSTGQQNIPLTVREIRNLQAVVSVGAQGTEILVR